MIMDDAALIAPGDGPPEVARPPSDRDVLGNDVLTERGVSLGTVSDLALVVGGTGTVVGYRITKEMAGPVTFRCLRSCRYLGWPWWCRTLPRTSSVMTWSVWGPRSMTSGPGWVWRERLLHRGGGPQSGQPGQCRRGWLRQPAGGRRRDSTA